jgi:competence protein ComEA
LVSEQIRERLNALERRELVGLVIIAVLVVAGAVFWYTRSLPSPVHVVATAGGGGSRAPAAGPVASPSASPKEIVVDVAGWVKTPGVYDFHQGDRVIDAIRQAGGARPGADLTTINLAALLTDAEQIVVGKASGGGPVSSTTVGSGGGGSSGDGSNGAPVNINTATLDQLESLPGIGPALGQRIIDYRQQHGPFKSVNDLTNVSGIGDKRLADLRQLITV